MDPIEGLLLLLGLAMGGLIVLAFATDWMRYRLDQGCPSCHHCSVRRGATTGDVVCPLHKIARSRCENQHKDEGDVQ
jgi:hypothetical protein